MKTEVFQDGEVQAVVIPEDLRISDSYVSITKVGESVILTPVSSAWAGFLQGLEMFSSDSMEDGRIGVSGQMREEF